MFIEYTTTKMTGEKCHIAKLKSKTVRLNPTLAFFFFFFCRNGISFKKTRAEQY